MRVVCENCGTSYKIPESKLVKEVNKATCRKCGFQMMIRRPTEKPNEEVERTDPTEAATQVTLNPLERQDAEREVLDAATRIEKGPAPGWEEDSPTNVQSVGGESAPSAASAAKRSAPVGAGNSATDMTIALVGTFASAAGAMLLATNTSGMAAQRMGGLGIALWGALVCLFLLVTGNLWRQKGNVPISVALATVLSIGGTGFVELALHSNPSQSASVSAGAAPQPDDGPATGNEADAADSLAEEIAEPVDADVANEEEGEANTEAGDTPVAVGGADKTADGVVDAAPVAPPVPAPKPPAEDALDDLDLDDLVAPTPPTEDNADERRRLEMEAAAAASAERRRQQEAQAAEQRAAAERAEREAAARQAAAAAPPAANKMKSLPLTVVDTMIRSNMSVKRCFFNEKQRAGEMPARVNVQFTVLQSGRVSTARVITEEYKGGPLDGCLSRAFKAIQFPAFEGESLSMNYPFVL